MSDLKVWHNGYDWFIAESKERAIELACKFHGTTADDIEGDGWEQWPDDRTITIHSPDAEPHQPIKQTMPASKWVETEGAEGFLCSTEW